jgi:hypothetical protein
VLAILLRQNLWALSVRKRLRYFMQRDGMSLACSRSALSASSPNQHSPKKTQRFEGWV